MSQTTLEMSGTQEPIAIVGMSCLLAGGVDTPTKLWETLVDKKIQQSTRIPASRFNIDAYFHEKAFGRPSAIGSKGGFFLETDLHTFDADFFGYEADEANHMDPQHFRVLESVYECLESAGRTMEDVKGTNTAVYIGNFSLDQVIKSSRNSYDDRHLHEVIGVDPGLMSSRVSYCYDLNGPVYTTNTGCTSSLYALHTAAMALRGGECSSAIVGGCNLLQGPEAYSAYSKFGIMSPDSMCHSFDARCNGYCRGEGVGTLLVRRLSDAVRDGDPIRGVIRSIAVNANGFVPNLPLFVPNENGLAHSMQLAYAQANLNPADTAYIETHGIGMIFGEIAEGHAVGKFYNKAARREKPLLMGSLKPNFGHQEAGSGIFVLIKSALMTEKGIIPAHADYQTPHPAINMEQLNIKPQTETIPWPEEFTGHRVALNSYGWSGTNAHIIVEDVQTLHPGYSSMAQSRCSGKQDHSTTRPFLLTFSAFSETSLKQNITNYAAVADEYYLADLAYTLNERRSKFRQRAFTIAKDGEAAQALASTVQFGTTAAEVPKVRLSFGTATSLRTLAAELLVLPAFGKSLAKLNALLATTQLETYIQEQSAAESDVVSELAIKIAVADLLASWQIKTVAITGEDLGVAYAVGKFSAAEASEKAGAEHIEKAADWRHEPAEEAPAAVTLVIGAAPGDTQASILSVTDLNTLLQAAGQLYLQGYPVDLAQVNDAGQDWKPSLVVDLPHYSWDHSRTFVAESYANKEHRINKHAYHDLLGRRVFGLSPDTMVWKNKLSFRDLPDRIPFIPNEKPLISMSKEQYMFMMAEALSQGYEGKSLSDFTVVDLQFHDVLQYAEDVDLVELQTSITKIPGRKDIYGVAVQMVKDGIWTTHCEGTIHIADGQQQEPHKVSLEQWATSQLQIVPGQA